MCVGQRVDVGMVREPWRADRRVVRGVVVVVVVVRDISNGGLA